MLDQVKKCLISTDKDFTFSILIPTWNNLDYLKNCIRSIRKHSKYRHQLIIVVNEGQDGTVEWLNTHKDSGLDYIHAKKNIGICYAVNIARSLVKSAYVMYLNDDMHVLPDWDIPIFNSISKQKDKMFMLSSTMVEPDDTGNPCVVVADYGRNLEDFQEAKLINNASNLVRQDWQGSMWPPSITHIDTWDMIGGFSVEFSPGMYSDPDFVCKLYHAGVRRYLGIGNSLVYHFGSKSTRRLKKNSGRAKFLDKWGFSANAFKEKILHLGQDPIESLAHKDLSLIRSGSAKIKRIINVFRS